MIELLFKREDGSFVAKVNGHPYHVIPGDEPLWSQAAALSKAVGKKLEFEPPPQPIYITPSTQLPKAELWRRCTEAEAIDLKAALTDAPVRLQEIFAAAQCIDATDADYPAIRSVVVTAVGETRANELLEPWN